MASFLNDLWDIRGRTGRGRYLLWGAWLMAIKYNLDRLLAYALFNRYWTWYDYWHPVAAPIQDVGGKSAWFLWALVAVALPFIGAGIVLTIRRLRDIGWPLALVVLFFIPVLNLVLFTILVLMPGRNPGELIPGSDEWTPPTRRGFIPQSTVGSALFSIALTVLLTVPLVALSTMCFSTYGWGVFVALPFCLGMVSAMIHGMSAPRSWRACVGIAVISLLLCSFALLCVAIEGLVCVGMAAPLATPLVVLGATVGYSLQRSRWNRVAAARLYVSAWVAIPMAMGVESFRLGPPSVIGVTTSVDVAASPEVVWTHVVTFSELPPPQELVFRSGIAYPVRARIEGHGVGALRRCEFSTGPFVEPITVWDEPRLLAFDVTSQPEPMRELSPYRNIHPPHLDGFFLSKHGQFLLTRLPDGGTRLEGTTWYQQRLWPARYWQTWSDWLVHTIHQRVLLHIKAESEAAAKA